MKKNEALTKNLHASVESLKEYEIEVAKHQIKELRGT